jgi:ubiquinone biosynthesis accessory factor UbiK
MLDYCKSQHWFIYSGWFTEVFFMVVSPLEFFNAVNQQLGQFLPDVAKSAQQDFNQQAKAALTSLVSRLELVTREDFEVQQQVLLRTREKLEAMEARVAALEAKLALADGKFNSSAG